MRHGRIEKCMHSCVCEDERRYTVILSCILIQTATAYIFESGAILCEKMHIQSSPVRSSYKSILIRISVVLSGAQVNVPPVVKERTSHNLQRDRDTCQCRQSKKPYMPIIHLFLRPFFLSLFVLVIRRRSPSLSLTLSHTHLLY